MWKTSKDKLIEYLQAELARARDEVAESRAQAAEALKLAADAVRANNEPVKEAIPFIPPPRTLADRCRQLTERSLQRARAKTDGSKLVAEPVVRTAAGPIPASIAPHA